MGRNAMPSMRDGECGQGVTLSRRYSAHVLSKAAHTSGKLRERAPSLRSVNNPLATDMYF
jgi:hypothetical protein